MNTVQFIKTPAGDDMVVLSRRDYDALLARAGDEAAEDRMTVRILDETTALLADGEDASLPSQVWEDLEAEGASPVSVLRKHRGLTQAALAEAAGIKQGYLSALEAGNKGGSPATLKRLARALRVPVDVLI